MFKRALISVSDKTHLEKLGRFLSENGCELVSTGGSAKALKSAGLPVIEVSELTGFPEVMDGRVKTLHPKIHMGLLARKDNQEDLQTLTDQEGVLFDLVVVNLYPFEETLKKSMIKSIPLSEQVEQIDIGGPTLLRAASKSFERITVLSHPNQYEKIFNGELSLIDRRQLAAEAFFHVSSYDSLVAEFLLSNSAPDFGPETSFGGRKVSELRYGENPHQKAWWFSKVGSQNGWQNAQILQGKELSYNNLLDLDAAQSCLSNLSGAACVVVKHNNPCGAAVSEDGNLLEAVDKAINADPLSCFGGIVAVNSAIDKAVAVRLSELFLECVVAPEISDDALEIFKKKKNQRILISKDLHQIKIKFTSIWGGFLVQTSDEPESWNNDWQIIGETPTIAIRRDLELAWKVCASLKSNAIALVGEGQTRGLGMGQVSRVDAVEQAIHRFQKFHPSAQNTVAASDAFFPFSDSIEKLSQAGVKWVIQPGGSVKDKEVIARAQELGMNMILTGKRHFRH